MAAARGLYGNPPMVDRLTPEQCSNLMRRVLGKDTAPEMVVRRIAHGAGFRYRLHRKDLPGKPDLCFPARRKIIFVHGCFWHGHDCKLGRLPKIAGNQELEMISFSQRVILNFPTCAAEVQC